MPAITGRISAAKAPARKLSRPNLGNVPVAALEPLAASEISSRGPYRLPKVGRNRELRRATPGAWQSTSDGGWRWSAGIRSRGARGIRLHFQNFDAGTGEVWIHDGDPETGQVFGPYIGRGIFGDGDFWTELIFQDTAYIEYRSADGHRAENPPFDVAEIFHLWQDFSPAAFSTGCFLDASCYLSSDPAGQLSKAVAFLLIGDHVCTGALISDRSRSLTPYLLTAGHCIYDQNQARATIAYFNYRSSNCGGPIPDYRQAPQVLGADLLARNLQVSGDSVILDAPDYAFLRLTSLPANTEVSLLGWELNATTGQRLTSISHPLALPQRLATGTVTDDSNPNFYIVGLFQGALDHGSSGSPLVNDANQLVSVDSFGTNLLNLSVCETGDREVGQTKMSAIYPYIRGWLEGSAQSAKAAITVPAPASVLTGASVAFSWSSVTGAAGYTISAGSQLGGQELFTRDFGTATSGLITGLPEDGRLVYVRLTTRSASGSALNDYVYTASRSAAPATTSLSPASVPALSAAFALTIRGSSFASGAIAKWSVNGQTTNLITTFGGTTLLTAQVPAGLLVSPGTASITVSNLSGSTSNATAFTITAPPLTVSNLSHYSVTAGGAAFTLTLNGSGFLSPASVLWNGSALPTALINSTQLAASVSAAAIATAGTASIVVSSAGRSSTPVMLTILPQAPPIYSNAVLSKSAPSSNGCARPPASTSFVTSDAWVYLYFEAVVLKSQILSSEWMAPDGSVTPTVAWGPSEGITCFTASVNIGDLPANRLGAWQVRVYEHGVRLFAMSFTVSAGTGNLPVIAANEVRNGAGFQQTVAPGSWFQIKGSNLSSGASRTWRPDEIAGGRLPVSLDGVTVTIEGKPAFVYYISPGQINALAPANLATGLAQVVVNNNGRASAPSFVTVEPFSPAFFSYRSTWTVATTADYRIIGNPDVVPGAVAAKPGDVIILWGTGFGVTNPPIPNGQVIAGAPEVISRPAVTIGGAGAPVSAAGMSPGSAGLYQIAVRIPNLPDGDHEVIANTAGYTSPRGYTIHVRNRL